LIFKAFRLINGFLFYFKIYVLVFIWSLLDKN
jgi:hypothetical protein